jgi:hypothetical protein
VRPFAAAESYRAGLARTVLVSDVRTTRPEQIGVVSAHGELNRQVLLRLGVPPGSVQFFGVANRNTYDEALALKAWAERTHARNLIVPTGIFSARRVHWILESVLKGTGVRLQIQALDAVEYGPANWWRSEAGLLAFQNELIKYAYYRFSY